MVRSISQSPSSPTVGAALRILLAAAILSLPALPAAAQQPNQPCGQSASAQPQEPATPKGTGQENGSAPANAGNTGWTGGTGGSYVGTTPAGAVPSSPTPQPEVARGLDPMKSTPRQPAAC
jgi:hypothetical protein